MSNTPTKISEFSAASSAAAADLLLINKSNGDGSFVTQKITKALFDSSSGYLVNGGALGTPASGTLTNCTGLPVGSGVSGLGAGVATFLATPTSANLRGALADEAGTGSAYFVGGALGTPASGTLSGCSALPATGVSAGALASGMSATTQTAGDNSTKLATTAYVNSTTLPTRQVLTSGSGATYTTPAGCRQLRVRMVGGGGGGAGSGNGTGGAGGTGGTTTFNSINAIGGAGAPSGNLVGGAGGTGGSGGSSPTTFRTPGNDGDIGTVSISATVNGAGGTGAGSLLGGGGSGGQGNSGGADGTAAAANTGAGGGGGGLSATITGQAGGGGGSGEYVEYILNSPSATLTYSIGASGTAGTAGTSGKAGGAGGTGIIIVDELY